MLRRRLLVPLLWLVATATAATLVSGAVRLAVRSVAPPAIADRPSGGHHRSSPTVAATLGAGGLATSGWSASKSAQLVLPVEGGGGPGAATDAQARGGPAAVRSANGGTVSATGDAAAPAASGGGSATATTAPATANPAPGAVSTPPTTATTSATNPPPDGTPSASTSTTSTTAPSSSPSSTTSTTAPPSSTTSTTSNPTYAYHANGGSIGVQCNGDSVSLAFASPADGYQATVDSAGPTEVDVRFVSSDHVSSLRVTCSGGQPDGHVTEANR